MLTILLLSGLWLMCKNSLFMMLSVMILMGGVLTSLYMNKEVVYVGVGLELDKLSWLMITLCLWMVVIMMKVSGDVKQSGKMYSGFFSMVILLNIILMFTFSSNDFIWFFIFFEVTMIPTLALIIGWGYQPERLGAMFYMFIYTMASSLPLLIVFLSSMMSNNSSYFFLSNYYVISGGVLGFIFLVVSMLVKLPIYSLHLWLPKAHVEAPLAGSIVLAAILLKLGGYGIFRLMGVYTPLLITNSDKLMMLGLLGAVLSSIVCVRQVDVKSLIAYSSIAHMGVMLSAMSSMSGLGMLGGVLMMVSHGFSSSFLFCLAFMNYNIYGSRSALLASGLLKVYPIMSLMWFMASMMGLGVPPSLNFVAEVNINCSVILSGVVCMLVLSGVLFVGAVYSLYLYTSSNHGLVMSITKLKGVVSLSSSIVGLMHLYPGYFLVLVLGVFSL